MTNQNFDKQLIVRLINGDEDAFDILYDIYHKKLYSNIFSLVKDSEITRDLVQEVFISLWEKRGLIDVDQPIGGWLFTVSYNKSLKYLRQSVKLSILNHYLDDKIEIEDDVRVSFKETHFKLLEQATSLLTGQKRKVFELCKVQHKTYEEAAKELNISKYTVKEYLTGAMENIKEFFKNHPDDLNNYVLLILLSSWLH